jgi:hypothetical protein
MSRCALPLAALLAALAPATVLAQQAQTTPYSPSPLGVRWSMPINRVTRHAPSWSATDIGLAGSFLAILWVDAAQTRSVARGNWKGFQEANPIIGPRPTVGQINTYSAAAAITTLGVAAVLPARARRWWLIGALAVEAYAVTGTTSTGISLRIN